MSRPDYDGGLLLFEEKTNSIRIYNGEYKKKLGQKDILWEWLAADAKSAGFRSSFSKTKNDVKQVMWRGELHLLAVSSRGDGVALIRFDDGELAYYRKVVGSVHSATVTPRDNIVLADSKGYVRLLSTRTGKTSQCPVNSAHGVVWDKKQELLWAWGGGGRIVGFPLGGSAQNPTLVCRKAKRFVGGPSGGHDLQPMLDGNQMLIGSAGSNIFFFEPLIDWPHFRWGLMQRFPGETGIKGVSRNSKTGEIIYVKNDRSYGYKFRSNKIRSLDGRVREVEGRTAFYKARWFQPNCFSW